ncbi:unnamed protein product [Symbiodinium pilosum]|uniref:Bacterial surface antigen (D15) domain-containing protein n=1 Tax=Symbiodinium pilosum TaxID=2952 RepID=A0A812JV49_SYMPI|nr:unnamed protein product [Symbiodinium pilosum]
MLGVLLHGLFAFCPTRVLRAGLVETFTGGLQLLSKLRSESWLEKWLWNLRIQIPTFSDAQGGFKFTVSDGLCTNFKLQHIRTEAVYQGLSMTAAWRCSGHGGGLGLRVWGFGERFNLNCMDSYEGVQGSGFLVVTPILLD